MTAIPKPPSSFDDTLMINSTAAIFFIPDSVQLEKYTAEVTKMVYESSTHENFYQMRNAKMVIKKYYPELNIVETSDARYLLFVKSDNTRKIINLDHVNDMWGIFLFDRKNEPELIDMMNIETALYNYFGK